jgi:hypothetical protein
MRNIAMILAGAALLAVAPASAARLSAAEQRAALAAKAEAKMTKALEGRVAGNPVRCISLNQVRSSAIVDRTAILYTIGNTVYVNRPDIGATSLDDDDIMVTKTTGSQLCDMDTVHMVDRASRFPTGFAGLGKFVPYKKMASAE